MLFNSSEFLIFFPIVVTLFFTIPHRVRWILLLASSYVFYMAWEPSYAVLILASTIVDFVVGRLMYNTDAKRTRLIYLLISLFANLGLLFVFKYFNLFAVTLNSLFNMGEIDFSIPESNFLLPIGISFYTFQTLSYTIEIYRGTLKPEPHFGKFALYVAFFPQLVAGPIERASNLLPQFRKTQSFDYHRVVNGLQLMAWGLFKKVVIADRLSELVDMIFSDPHRYSGPGLYIASVFFTFQIYCDFSGYSDMAIGAAEVMGFKLMRNFNRPYFAKSASDFWHRWHISLSTWFRDYLYIPLGGNRVKLPRWYFNLFFVFLISGLWHGASWTFVVWGAFHGIWLVLSYLLNKPREYIFSILTLDKRPQLLRIIQVLFAFNVVNIGYIIFRARTIENAFYYINHLLTGWSSIFDFNSLMEIIAGFGIKKSALLIDLALIAFLIGIQLLQRKGSVREMIAQQSPFVRWAAYYALILGILLLGVFNNSQFIYFQF